MSIEELVNRAYTSWAHEKGTSWTDHMRAALTEQAEAYEQRIDELTGVRLTVGDGLSVYGTGEAIRRAQAYILLDSSHPSEAKDTARHFANALQAAEQRIRELEAQRVPEGWKSWRDVAVHGYPKEAQEVLFVRYGKTVHGAFIGGIFWHSNERCAAALWMPLPTPLTPDAHRAMLSAAPKKEPRHD